MTPGLSQSGKRKRSGWSLFTVFEYSGTVNSCFTYPEAVVLFLETLTLVQYEINKSKSTQVKIVNFLRDILIRIEIMAVNVPIKKMVKIEYIPLRLPPLIPSVM